MAKRFQALKTFLEQHLKDVKVYRTGKGEVLTFALGKFNYKTYAGLKTTVIVLS